MVIPCSREAGDQAERVSKRVLVEKQFIAEKLRERRLRVLAQDVRARRHELNTRERTG